MINSATEFILLRESTVVEEYTRAATDDAPLEVWLELVHAHPDMRFWVAQNKTVPTEILEILAKDDDARVRSMVASKRKTSRGLLTGLTADPHDSVRHSVVRNPAAPLEALRLLADDSWETIRRVATERMADS